MVILFTVLDLAWAPRKSAHPEDPNMSKFRGDQAAYRSSPVMESGSNSLLYDAIR